MSATASGARLSESRVKPTMSANTTVAVTSRPPRVTWSRLAIILRATEGLTKRCSTRSTLVFLQHAVGHAVVGLDQMADLVIAAFLDAVLQVALAHGAGGGEQIVDRLRQPPADQEGGDDRQHAHRQGGGDQGVAHLERWARVMERSDRVTATDPARLSLTRTGAK